MNERTVLLSGRSLLLSLVAASLAQCSSLRVARATTWTEAGRLLAERMPDALVFDLADDCEGHILPLLLKNPSLLLIGLDPERNQAMLVSGQKTQALTLDQIREFVEGR